MSQAFILTIHPSGRKVLSIQIFVKLNMSQALNLTIQPLGRKLLTIQPYKPSLPCHHTRLVPQTSITTRYTLPDTAANILLAAAIASQYRVKLLRKATILEDDLYIFHHLKI